MPVPSPGVCGLFEKTCGTGKYEVQVSKSYKVCFHESSPYAIDFLTLQIPFIRKALYLHYIYCVKNCPAMCSEQNNLSTRLRHSGDWRSLAQCGSLGGCWPGVGGTHGFVGSLLPGSLKATPCVLECKDRTVTPGAQLFAVGALSGGDGPEKQKDTPAE